MERTKGVTKVCAASPEARVEVSQTLLFSSHLPLQRCSGIFGLRIHGGDAVEEGQCHVITFKLAGQRVAVRSLVVAPGEQERAVILPGGVSGDFTGCWLAGLAAGDEARWCAGESDLVELPVKNSAANSV